MNLGQPSSPLSVSQLNRQVKQLLETQYPMVPVTGEISTLSRPASGHIYFTLKDANAQIRCAMFKTNLLRNTYQPKQGDQVLVYGRLSLYEGRGDYQLIISSMQPQGEGALQAAFFQLKERLAAEGLFETSRKREVSAKAQRVGIVTSSTGAALHDILTVLKRRYPACQVVLYPSQVQGNEATATIVEAIQTANVRNEVDVLIVGRGGGSLEDLWCFNTEAVARAIYHSTIPIVSAVGHEVDVSISDFVADLRAATPSQAAELVSPDQFEIMQQVDRLEQRLQQAVSMRLRYSQQQLNQVSKRLKNPADGLVKSRQLLTTLQQRLTLSGQRALKTQQSQLSTLIHRLERASPALQLKQQQKTLVQLEQRLNRAATHIVPNKQQLLVKLAANLNILSPLATLDRGYSITLNNHGKVVSAAEQVQAGEVIETKLSDGSLFSTVNPR